MNKQLSGKMLIISNIMILNNTFEQDIAEVVLCAAYNEPDLFSLSEDEINAALNGEFESCDMALRISDVIDGTFNIASEIAVSLLRGEVGSETNAETISSDLELSYDIPEGVVKAPSLIPSVIEEFKHKALTVRANNAVQNRAAIEDIVSDIKTKVHYDFSVEVMSEFYRELLNEPFYPTPESHPFVGIFGDDVVDEILVIPCNSVILPDSNDVQADIFDRLSEVAKISETSIFLASLYPVFNEKTNQTCFGYGYCYDEKKWFPVFLSKNGSFIECFYASRDGKGVLDVDTLLAHAYARVQAGLGKEPIVHGYSVMDYDYEGSEWQHMEMVPLDKLF